VGSILWQDGDLDEAHRTIHSLFQDIRRFGPDEAFVAFG